MPPDTTQRPKHVDEADPNRFTILSSAMRALTKSVEVGKDASGMPVMAERMYLAGTASSNVRDRQGDILDAQCQASMLAQAKGLTMWLNHDYTVPESILGTCVGASLHTRAASSGEVIDLDIEVEVDGENPRAVKFWRHVQNGTKLAFSIGGIFTSFDVVEPDDDEDDFWKWLFPDLIVHDLELLEISGCGVPANPRAYTKSGTAFGATKGISAEVERIAARIGRKGMRDAGTRALVAKSVLGDRVARRAVDALPPAPAEEPALDADAVAALSETEPATAPAAASAEAPVAEPPAGTSADPVPPPAEVPTGDAPGAHDPDGARSDADPEPVAAVVEDATLLDAAVVIGNAAGAAPEAGTPAVPTAGLAVPTDEQVGAALAAALGDAPAVVPDTLAAATPATKDSADATAAPDADPKADSDTVSPVTDGPTQDRVVKAMRHVKKAMVHGLCQDSMDEAHAAHRAMLSLLPDDFDLPADAAVTVGDDDDLAGNTLALLVAHVKAGRLDPGSVRATLGFEPAPDPAERERAAAELEALGTAKAVLEEELRQLRATPVGRRSVAHPGGSRDNGQTDVVPMNHWSKSTAELAAIAGARMAAAAAGNAGRDARDGLT